MQLSKPMSQQQSAEVSFDNEESSKAPDRQLSTADSVVSQVAASSPQLSSSSSVLSEVAESAQKQPEDDMAESLQSEEASLPDQASAEQEADSAEGNYADEFEPDEPAAETTAVALPPQTMYDNPLGDDESAEQQQRQDSRDLNAWADAPHVATQLAVLDSNVVKLHCGLEDKDQPPEYNSDPTGDHVAPAAASAHAPKVNTELSEARGDAAKVQWIDVSRDEPEEDAEGKEDSLQGKGRSTKMPSTPFPRRSIFSASVSIADDVEPEEDAEEEDGNQARGRFSKMPSTPFPRKSIFSASGNMADDVDIFSTTQPGDDSASDQDESASASDFGGSLHRLLSDVRQDSVAESGMQLTPSYRQTQGRSLQQAADNEQPFAASWRPQPAKEAAQGAEAVTSASTAMSQKPSRQSSLASSQGQAASGDIQSSLSTAGTTAPVSVSANEAAAAAVPAPLPSHASLPVQFSLDSLASGSLRRQPSNVTAPASAVSSRRSSFNARIELETSQLLGVRQGSNAGSLAGADQPSQGVSRTASLGTNPMLSPELSSSSVAPTARPTQEASEMVSKRSSFSKPAEPSQQSSQISRQSSGEKSLAAAAAPSATISRTASRQPSFTKPAALSRQSSQVSRQSSMVSVAAASPAASRVVSRQASLTQPIALSRQASQVSRQPSTASVTAAVAPSPAASRVASRQASLTQPTALSRQASQVSRQPSTASVTAAVAPSPAASRMASRQASLTQPVALSRQASQIARQPSTASTAAAAAPSEMAFRVATRQPSFNGPASSSRQSSQREIGGSDPVTSHNASRVPSRQQSLVTSGHLISNQLLGSSPSVSRSQSMSSQPRRSNSLEAMHRQMSMPRKATAVAVRKLSQDNEGMATSSLLSHLSCSSVVEHMRWQSGAYTVK